MALIQFDFFSETLRIATQVNIAFSQRIKKQKGPGHRSPVLYLLHGLSDNQTAWTRKTSIERYVEAYDLIVVMPAVNRSFYRNTYSGARYFDFISDELPEICRNHFSISEDPAKTFVAGLSMGGYGAFKLALTLPKSYAAAASLSGVLDLNEMSDHREEFLPDWPHIFGPNLEMAGSNDDLLHLSSQLIADKQPIPQLYQCCGTEDYLYSANQSFLKHARKTGLPVQYEEDPGTHEWGYWDQQIQKVLQWLPLEKLETEEPRPNPTSKQNDAELS